MIELIAGIVIFVAFLLEPTLDALSGNWLEWVDTHIWEPQRRFWHTVFDAK